MPFTLEGEWAPIGDKGEPKISKPVKVRLIKRGKSILTVILNLSLDSSGLIELASALKKKLGCGGAVKDSTIEIQGDKVEQVKEHLNSLGIKNQ